MADESSLRFRGTRAADAAYLEKVSQEDGVIKLPSGLMYKVVKEQKDKTLPSPKASTPCQCHYSGRLVDGKEFDSSYKRGKPTTFAPNQVIQAWKEAMQLMREGDKWELYVPASLGYGSSGTGPIPGGAALIFEMELVKIEEEGGGSGWLPILLILGGLAFVAFMFMNQGSAAAANMQVVSLDAASSPANPRVFFDMEIGGEAAGRIEMELFSTVTPKTAENFRALSTGEKGIGNSGKPLYFKDSKFHRIIPGFMCQGGDITRGNGMGGESIYGGSFADEFENGMVKHTGPFLLSMANRGKNTQSSQFFITTTKTSHLDGKHVVFGRVVAGEEVVRKMEEVGSSSGTPSKQVRIADSGELK